MRGRSPTRPDGQRRTAPRPCPIRPEQGIALPLVLFLTTLVALIGGAALYSAATTTKLSGNLLAAEQAFWLAEAGLERGLNHLLVDRTDRRRLFRDPRPPSWSLTGQILGKGTYDVIIEQLAQDTVRIRATGRAAGATRKNEVQVVNTLFALEPPAALYAMNLSVVDPAGPDGRPFVTGLTPPVGSIPAVRVAASLADSIRTELADQAEGDPSLMETSPYDLTDAGGYSLLQLKARCDLCVNGPATITDQIWGTPEEPALVFIAAGEAATVTIGGTSSITGLLIVKNGRVRLRGRVLLQGLALVYGPLWLEEAAEVHGAVLVDHSDVRLQQSALIVYSGEDIEAARWAPSASRVVSWREAE